MDSVGMSTVERISLTAGLEARLAGLLADAADEVAHAECFDEEQRAEVYTILNTLQADVEMHRGMISLLGQSRMRMMSG